MSGDPQGGAAAPALSRHAPSGRHLEPRWHLRSLRPLDPGIVRCLARRVPKLCEHARGLEGKLTLRAQLGYEPELPRPWRHDIRVALHDGKLAHPQVPFILDHIDAEVRCRDGDLRLE